MVTVVTTTQKEIENKLKEIIALALSDNNNATIIELCFEIMEKLDATTNTTPK